VVLLVIIVISIINSLATITTVPPNRDLIIPLVQVWIALFIGAIICGWFSSHVFYSASKLEQSLDERLLGYVMSNEASGLDLLARWIGLTQKEVADRLARLVSQGALSGYFIDIPRQMVIKAPGPTSTPDYNPAPAATPALAEASHESADEVVKTKAKLYELEMLRKQGKISNQTYNKLKEEYERKLSESDTGTQVY
jgi:hypothetical protein